MKAIRIEGIGGPEQLKIVEIEPAKALSGEVLINVELAGVNFIDVYHRRGQYQLPLPTGLGIEGIGRSTSGEKYFWLSAMGSYAQQITIPRKNLTAIPDTQLSNEELLPLLCQGMTAHYLANSAYPAQSGEFALVTAAAGGVGMLLIQLLKEKGVEVIALTSSIERAQIARECGADYVGTYEEMSTLVNQVTSGAGVNVVYDSVGADAFDDCLESLAHGGMYVLYGGASGPVPPFDLMRLNSRSLAIRRPTLATYTATESTRVQRLTELINLKSQNKLKYPATKVFPLNQTADAHILIESRSYSGKIGLDPWKI